jgi:hypothetical protein
MSGTTPSSGQISLNNLQSVFGGTNPINFSEYYLNASTGYTTGVSGIPNTGTQIALSNFYGKTKPVASSYPPAAVQTNQGSFGMPWGFGSTSLEWLTGASGTNLTRTGGSTFNNLGSYGASRTNFVNSQNLILQAKPGDTLRFVIQNGAAYASDYEVNSLLLHLGGGWFNVQSVGGSGGHTDTIDYTLSASLAPGSYGIAAYNNYSSAGSSSYASGNFYSLHVVA